MYNEGGAVIELINEDYKYIKLLYLRQNINLYFKLESWNLINDFPHLQC